MTIMCYIKQRYWGFVHYNMLYPGHTVEMFASEYPIIVIHCSWWIPHCSPFVFSPSHISPHYYDTSNIIIEKRPGFHKKKRPSQPEESEAPVTEQ